ncbi:ACP phosphodiesterase [Solimonas variicoloris]|uniref:ACP phosphodiesterase n=1 Tax=Solimonas variicoloris TaxID=254408 RepID=UPI00037116F3|nr:ACP phosphodiesterase [Solimonas variicoloris]
MNFLAHLWLADRTGTSLAGSVLGDVVRGAELGAYPAEIALGVRLHRRVDALTDRHPLTQALRAGFPTTTRRYAGIVLDLAADYALARDWARHADEPLPAFAARAGAAIAAAAPWFELAGGRRSSAQGFSALLLSYGEAAGIDRAVQRTAQRLREPQALLGAASGWREQVPALQAALPALLADLRTGMQTEALR